MKQFANNAFIAECGEIDKLLNELITQRATHFGVKPDQQRNWGEVETVRHIRKRLEQAALATRSNIIE